MNIYWYMNTFMLQNIMLRLAQLLGIKNLVQNITNVKPGTTKSEDKEVKSATDTARDTDVTQVTDDSGDTSQSVVDGNMWLITAQVLDRLFFWIFLFATVLAALCIFF